jgi:hypothetical protein
MFRQQTRNSIRIRQEGHEMTEFQQKPGAPKPGSLGKMGILCLGSLLSLALVAMSSADDNPNGVESIEQFRARLQPRVELAAFQGAVRKEMAAVALPDERVHEMSFGQLVQKLNRIITRHNESTKGVSIPLLGVKEIDLPDGSTINISGAEIPFSLDLKGYNLEQLALHDLPGLSNLEVKIERDGIWLLTVCTKMSVLQTRQYRLPSGLNPQDEPMKSALKRFFADTFMHKNGFDKRTRVLTVTAGNRFLDEFELWYAQELERRDSASTPGRRAMK